MSASLKHQLHVSDRIVKNQKASKLGKEGLTIANIFGEDLDSQAITLNRSDFLRYLKSEGDSGLLYLVAVDKTETPVLIDEIQYEPVSNEPLHITFKRVNLKEKVVSEVPLEMVGEADIHGATVFLVKDVLEVEALPTDLPEQITLDISNLTKIGESLHLSDAMYDRAKVTVILTEEELEEPLVIVQELKEEVEEVEEEPTESEQATDKATEDSESSSEDASSDKD